MQKNKTHSQTPFSNLLFEYLFISTEKYWDENEYYSFESLVLQLMKKQKEKKITKFKNLVRKNRQKGKKSVDLSTFIKNSKPSKIESSSDSNPTLFAVLSEMNSYADASSHDHDYVECDYDECDYDSQYYEYLY